MIYPIKTLTARQIADAVSGRLIYGSADIAVTSVSTDSRTVDAGTLYIPIKGENFDGHSFICDVSKHGVSGYLCSDGQICEGSGFAIMVEDTRKALLKLASYYRSLFNIPVVGITGSVGKTTTKEMIAAVLSTAFNTCKTAGNFNNHIGLPLTVLGLSEKHTAAVIEMGMSAKGEISYLTQIAKPTVAVITNVGLSHIENLGSQENIRDAKLEIAEGLPKGGTLFVNGDDPLLKDVSCEGVQVVRFGFENQDCEILGTITSEDTFTVDDTAFFVPVAGKHNLYNALAAYSIGKACGICAEKAKAGILSYKPDGIRQSEKEIRPGITVICDYYNASPASMEVALQMLARGEAKRRIAVLGDMLELGEIGERCHREVGEKAASLGTDVVLCVGPLSAYAAESAQKSGVKTVKCFANNQELSSYLSSILKTGDRVLIKGSHGMKMEEIFEKIR